MRQGHHMEVVVDAACTGYPRRRLVQHAPQGFTMVELLVAMTIIGLLMALVLPAVQRARAASQNMSCKNLLKQIVLAAHMYEESYSVLPVSNLPCRRLLPFVGRSALYHLMEENPFPKVDYGVIEYLCPSDPEAQASLGHISYLVNQGSGDYRLDPSVSFDGARPGPFGFSKTRDFTDGTSNTTLFAERKIMEAPRSVTSDDIAQRDSNRYMWLLNRDFQLPSSTEFAAFRAECLASRATAIPQHYIPFNYKLQLDEGYNHGLTPNRPGCHNNTPPGTRYLMSEESLISSTSHHSGGVNVGFVDGHVRFVTDSIDAGVWTAISTRKGHETVGDF